MAAISKTALAALLGVSKPRVSQYVREGLPVLSTGKIDRDTALNWINRNKVESGPSGSPGVKTARALGKRGKALGRPPQSEPNPVDAAMMIAVAEIVSRSAMAARLAAQALGLPVRTAYLLSYLVQYRLGEDGDTFLDRVHVPREASALGAAVGPLHWSLEPDWRALAVAAGEAFNEAEWEGALSNLEAALA